MTDQSLAAQRSKVLVMGVIGLLLLFSIVVLISGFADADGIFSVILAIVICGIAISMQCYFLWRINNDWLTMSVGARWKYAAAGIFLPILAAVAGFFAIAIGLVVLAFAIARGALNLPSFPSLGGRQFVFKERFGNEAASLDVDTGEVRDRYGNRTACFDSDTGVTKDVYGNVLGSVDRDMGEFRDLYGNRKGSVDPNSGVVKDEYGSPLGFVE
jgi:hypothetical protein